MAAGNAVGEESQLSFPLPPTFYYKHYTDENIKNGIVPKPPIALNGEYALFGHIYKTDDEIIQPLETQGIPRLYSKDEHFDHIVEMKKLNHSILVNYMELVDIMIEAPASAERLKKIEEIKILFINLHHLINEFRPHQARETLRIMLYRQKQQRLDTVERLKRNIEKTRSILKICSSPQMLNSSMENSIEDSKAGVLKEKTLETSEELRILQRKIMCDIVDEIS